MSHTGQHPGRSAMGKLLRHLLQNGRMLQAGVVKSANTQGLKPCAISMAYGFKSHLPHHPARGLKILCAPVVVVFHKCNPLRNLTILWWVFLCLGTSTSGTVWVSRWVF